MHSFESVDVRGEATVFSREFFSDATITFGFKDFTVSFGFNALAVSFVSVPAMAAASNWAAA